ncbi:MAG: sulfite exporter TauE/SafE family protein [Candidatus Baltobacteraceae bacterium]
MAFSLELFAAALLASIFGSMVGLGGGFILVPALLLIFGFAPAEAAGTSLVLVVANSGAGSLTYLLGRRVHIKIGLLLAAGGLPGSIVGALLVQRFSPQIFDLVFGIFLLVVAADLLLNPAKRAAQTEHAQRINALKGMSYRFSIVVGFFVGLISSLFGIGGGVIVLPTLLYFSELPAHAISATSHFAIFLTSPVGLLTHAFEHSIRPAAIAPLLAGGLIGGPLGAQLSLRLRSPALMKIVGAALSIVAFTLIAHTFLRS